MNPKKFQANRKVLDFEMAFECDPERAFSLLCPVKEGEYLDGWSYELHYSQSGMAEADAVFTTRHGEAEDTVWVITRRDAEQRSIEFVYFIPGNRVTRLRIGVSKKNKNQSQVSGKYIHTAISEAGNQNLAALTENGFQQNIRWWERSVNHYLLTGEQLKRKHKH